MGTAEIREKSRKKIRRKYVSLIFDLNKTHFVWAGGRGGNWQLKVAELGGFCHLHAHTWLRDLEGHQNFPGNATPGMSTTQILPSAVPKFRISHHTGEVRTDQSFLQRRQQQWER